MQHRAVILTVILCEYMASLLFMSHWFADVNHFSTVSFSKIHIFNKNVHYTKNETSIKDFFSKYDQSERNCGSGYIYWKNPQFFPEKILNFIFCSMLVGLGENKSLIKFSWKCQE